MKNKFFVGIPGFDIKVLMGFVGQVCGRSLKTQESYIGFINEMFTAKDGSEVVKEGNVSRQARGEVSFTTKKEIVAVGEIEIGQGVDCLGRLQQLTEYFSLLTAGEAMLTGTKGCYEKYSAQKANEIYVMLEKYCRIAKKLSVKKQQQILAGAVCIVLSFFVYNGRDWCTDVEMLYTDPFVEKLRDKNRENIPADNRPVYPELYARVNNGGRTVSLVQLIRQTGRSHLYISAEGGGGKTTSVLAAVSEMHMEDEAALYIDAKQIDTYQGNEKNYFLLNRIGNLFDEYINGNEKVTDRYNLVNGLLAKECRQLTVFIDGLNEAADRDALVEQIRALANMDKIKLVITGRYFSSRLASAVAPLQYRLERPQDVGRLVARYCPQKSEGYRMLDETTRQLLRTPMFFALYCEEKDVSGVIDGAKLLKSSLMRTLDQQKINYGNLAQFVLTGVLPQFVAHICKNQPVMSFNRRQFADFIHNIDADADIYRCAEIIITSAIVNTTDSQNFYFAHENFRDFLWGYALAQATGQSGGCDGLLCLPDGSFALKCFAQLAGRKTVRRLLNSRSAENMTEQDWHSRHNAKLTAVLFDCARILWDNRFGEGESDMFCGKNLSACDFRHCQIRDVAFDGSVIDHASFGTMGHTTAVWAVEKYRGRIYALDKNVLTCYTTGLERLDSCVFGGGQTIVSYARVKNMLCAVDKKGRVLLFDLDKMEKQLVEFSHSCSQVIAKSNGFVLGGTDCIYICDTQLNIEKTVIIAADGHGTVPVGCTPMAVIYGRGNSLYRYDMSKGEAKLLCTADYEISKGVSVGGAVVFAATDGRTATDIMVWDGEKLRRENTITARSDTGPFLASLNLNGAKINDISVGDEYIAMVCNDGMLYLYTNDEDISLTDVICLQNISVKNPSLTVESCGFADSHTIVCGFTDRSVKLIDVSPSVREKGRVIKQHKGSNNGIRKLFTADWGIAAAFYDRGAALLEWKSERLVPADKFVLSDSEWTWTGIQWGENLLFATGSYVTVYSPRLQKVTARKGFGAKVEAMFLSSEGNLYIAAGPSVYRAKNYDIENPQPVVRDKHSRRALCFAQKGKKLYIGFSGTEGHSACLKVVGIAATDTDRYEEYVWNYTDGWYRSLAFSADGQYLLCGGLKQNTAGGVQDVTAVYKVGEKQLKAAGVLTGHSKAVLLVLVTKNRAVTCSDDGCVNIYSLADMETDFHHPEKTVKVSENQLFDMVLMDETSLLTCSLDGNIYKVNINSGTATAVYTNIAGMYCTGCDFSRTINAKGEIL